jgi:predicted DNA-binding protein (MmcQ/YjbR family)
MAELRDAALAYPESHEDFPWGHSAIKIRTKVFVFLFLDPAGTQLTMSTKLPQSSEVALLLPFATPTGYGLARSGWVTASFRPGDEVPVDLLRSWIDESYRAVAPAKLAKQLAASTTTTKHTTTAKPSSTKTSSSAKPSKPTTAAKQPAVAARSSKPALATQSSKPATKPSKTAAKSSKSATKPSKTAAKSSKPALATTPSKPAATKPATKPVAARSSKPTATRSSKPAARATAAPTRSRAR